MATLAWLQQEPTLPQRKLWGMGLQSGDVACCQVCAGLKDTRDRIQSVKNTQKITDAMKLVAAAKVRRAQDAVVNGRPFAENLVKVGGPLDHLTACNLATGQPGAGLPLLSSGKRHIPCLPDPPDKAACTHATCNPAFRSACRDRTSQLSAHLWHRCCSASTSG